MDKNLILSIDYLLKTMWR